MSPTAYSLDQVEFELVDAVPGRSLLRVAAEPDGTPPDGDMILIVRGYGEPMRVAPLPSPAPPPGLVRAAFTLTAEVAAAAAGFSLELPGGAVVELPAPRRRSTARITPAPPVSADAAADTDPALSSLRERLATEREARIAADTQADASAAARAATAQRLDTLETEVAELRNELRAAQGEIELARTQANHARAEADAAEGALTQREAEIELLRVAVRDRDAQSRYTYEHWEQITAELSVDAEAARAETLAFRAHADELQIALATAQAELETLRLTDGRADGGPSDPAELARQLNRAAVALEESRRREQASQAELERLRGDGRSDG